MHRHQWGAIVKQFLSILIGAAIVAAAWVATFGNPLVTGQPAEVARASQPGQARAGRAGGGTMVTVAPVVVEPYNDVFRSVGTARAKSSGEGAPGERRACRSAPVRIRASARPAGIHAR